MPATDLVGHQRANADHLVAVVGIGDQVTVVANPYAYNRKERKDHGEGGAVVGAELGGRVLIVDDVLTAGTSAREAIGLVQDAGAEPVGLLLLLDRQERGSSQLSAASELAGRHGISVCCVFGLDSLLSAMRATGLEPEAQKRIAAYRKQYGAS